MEDLTKQEIPSLSVKILAESLEEAFLTSCEIIGCDLNSFDWLSYHPDFHYAEQVKKAA